MDNYVDHQQSLGYFQRQNKTSATKSLCYYEFGQYSTWFDKEYSELLNQRKYAKLQWFRFQAK